MTTSGGDVRIHRYGHNASVLDIDSTGWNLLVSSDVSWPGWRAYWNGTRQPSVIVNGAFVGCFIPPGKGQLTLRYAPQEFTQGARVSAVTLVLVSMIGIAGSVTTRRARSATLTRNVR